VVRLHCIALGLGVAFLVEEHSFSKLENGFLITHGVVVVICLFVLGQGVLMVNLRKFTSIFFRGLIQRTNTI